MLAKRIKELREKRQLTQNEVAKTLRITREAYSMYESDKRQMPYQSLCILADFYNVSVDYLLGRKEDKIAVSEAEYDIISKYRWLDDRGQETVRNIIDFEYNVQTKRANEIAEDERWLKRYHIQIEVEKDLHQRIIEKTRRLEEINRRITHETANPKKI